MSLTRRFLAPGVMAVTLLFAGAACGSSDDSSSPEAFCDKLEQLDASNEIEFDSLSDEEAAQQLKAIFDDLRSTAPPAIKSSVDRMADAVDAFAQIDVSDPEALNEAALEVDGAELDTAFEELDAYALEECGVDLGD